MQSLQGRPYPTPMKVPLDHFAFPWVPALPGTKLDVELLMRAISKGEPREASEKAAGLPFRFMGYVLEHVLGSGSYGVVISGYLESTPQIRVAVKICTSPSLIETIVREAMAYAELSASAERPGCSRMVTCLYGTAFSDLGNPGLKTDPYAMLIMEQMWNSLSGFVWNTVQGYGSKEAKILQFALIAHHMALDVAYVHSHGIIHGDIKTANMLCSVLANGHLRVKLADLGTACYGCNTEYERRADRSEEFNKTYAAVADVMEHVVDRGDIGTCRSGTTHWYASDWMNINYNSGKPPSAMCFDNSKLIANDNHCLAMSIVEVCVAMNSTDGDMYRPDVMQTSPWRKDGFSYSMDVRELYRQSTLPIDIPASADRKLRHAFATCATIVRDMLNSSPFRSAAELAEAFQSFASEWMILYPDLK